MPTGGGASADSDASAGETADRVQGEGLTGHSAGVEHVRASQRELLLRVTSWCISFPSRTHGLKQTLDHSYGEIPFFLKFLPVSSFTWVLTNASKAICQGIRFMLATWT